MSTSNLTHQLTERATDVTAAGAVSSPLWIHQLENISVFAEILLPILGVLWLVAQICYKVRNRK